MKITFPFFSCCLSTISVFIISFKCPSAFAFKERKKNEKCLVYTPAYPSAGGAGCSAPCTGKKGKKTSMYGAAFYNDNHQIWPKELVANMEIAASIVKKFGQPLALNTEGKRELHLSFDYYCCYTEEEGIKIGQFLNNYSWKPHEVWFDEMKCVIYGYDDATALVLVVDKKSQEDLTRWALKNEQDLEVKTGVNKHISHTSLESFHMTLALLNQSHFPVQSAVEEINRVISPGNWHKTPVTLRRPVCRGCQKLIKRLYYM